MHKVLLLVSCLACASRRHQVRIHSEDFHGRSIGESSNPVKRSGAGATLAQDASKAFTELLLASNPTGLFNPTSAIFDHHELLRRGSGKMRHGDRRQGATMSDKKLQLKYFDARGAAETSRILFALAGEEYEDTRYEVMVRDNPSGPAMEVPGFKAAKKAGELTMNLDRAPVLILEDGTNLGQSRAIERFLAKRFGFMGKSPVEEAMIDSITEHCRDVKDAQNRKGFGPFARKKTPEEKTAARSEWFGKELPSFLERIDKVIQETGSPGFAVGSSRSLADLVIFSILNDCAPADKEDTAKAVEKYSALKAIGYAVESEPSVAKWVKDRPDTTM